MRDYRTARPGRQDTGTEVSAAASPDGEEGLVWPWLTVERALYGAAVLVAAFLRLMALGSRPLDNAEAALAAEAWNALRGQPVDLLAQPLLVYGNALVFLLLGASDTTARLLPSLAGILAIGLPYALRDYLGRLGALGAAFLLAISPLFVYFATTVDSAGLALTLTLALIALLVHPELRLRPYLVGAAVALLLMSGPVGVAALALVATGAVVATAGPHGSDSGRLSLALGDLQTAAFWQRAGVTLAVIYGLGATGFGANLRGLQAGLPDGVSAWLGGIGFSSRAAALLVSYEPFTFLLAVVALGWSIARRPADNLLAGWAAAGLLLATLTGRSDPGMVLLAALPLLLLAGEMAGSLGARLGDDEFRRHFGWLALALGPWLFLLWLWAGHFSRPNADAMRVLGPTTPAVLLLPIGAIALTVVAYAVYRLGASLAGQLLVLGTALMLVVFGLHGSFNLLQPNLEMPGQLLLPRPTSPDVRALAQETKDSLDALAYLPGAGRQVQVEERYRTPLAWYLRDIPEVRFVPRASDTAAIVVQSVDSPVPSTKYRGRRYQLSFEMQGQPLASGADRLWRWFMYREPPASPLGEAVVMAVRGR